MTVLLLGGTAEAREVAAALTARGVEVITSLAGRLSTPTLPAGRTRSGGFGGVEALAEYLEVERVEAVVDATHPFAARITSNIVEALRGKEIPLIVLRRPPWWAGPDDQWIDVADLAGAARALADFGDRVLLTIGRQGVGEFADIDRWFLIRAIEAPTAALPRRHRLLLERGPFTVDGELDLLRRNEIDVLVTKNSGGPMTAAKLEAARTLSVPVVLVRRPALPAGVSTVDSVAGVLSWVEGIAGT